MRFHIVKRDHCSFGKRCMFYVLAVVIALLLGGVVLWAIGVNPVKYYTQMFTMGTIGNRYAYKTYMNYLKEFVPLVLTSIALSLAFKMKFWNIGGEGQFILGSVAASFVAFKFGPGHSTLLTLIVMCVSAMLAAGLYGLLAGALKVKFGTNETLMTLMLNYIALHFLSYLEKTKAPWNLFLTGDSVRPVFKSIPDEIAFPSIPIGDKFELDICMILTLIIGVLVYIYLKKTKQGYEISVVGDSAGTAHYAGMKVNKIVLRTVFISAALIGLAAAFKMSSAKALSADITNDVGWTGIIIAWLSQLNTAAIFIVSALICVLQLGTDIANATFSQVDAHFADMLQGIILFLVLAADFLIRFRVARVQKGGENNG